MKSIVIEEPAPAKLNLILRVAGRRLDGYHLLDMWNVCLSFGDTITLELVSEPSLNSSSITVEYSGDDSLIEFLSRDLSRNSEDLTVQAARKFLARYPTKGYSVKITLDKQIPIGAGLGGGSSDAAAVLRCLIKARRALLGEEPNFQSISEVDLVDIALQLGADVPFSLFDKPSLVSGIGEEVTALERWPWGRVPVVIIVPGVSISTPKLFGAFREKKPALGSSTSGVKDLAAELNKAKDSWPYHLICNDLEPTIVALYPEIGRTIEILRVNPDWIVGITGSGSALFVVHKKGARGDLSSSMVTQHIREFETENRAVSSSCRIIESQIMG